MPRKEDMEEVYRINALHEAGKDDQIPFTGIGRALKDTEGWELVLPTCLTNGSEGYFPMKEAYGEGGYETRSSNFQAGVVELIIEEGKKLMNDLSR